MKIQLFGNLVDLAGKNHVEVENQPTTDKLIELLVTRFPELKDHQFLIAVNHEVISGKTELHPCDEIALLPPFSGG
ncbi:MoaD/ThiS family protein [Aliifodinibius sp. S!AR15-10]|uniref:MoaD/ThiS family protein n=1 Tax=Aliifodinibius sp. S!AR15-10 TaxID=2950437 RepID=UPI002862C91E|nr:MoaD/ThiS family protein [Aliifodinibius sp. S!AR15-10]MDR8390736.1 MoaD/ThiS family protein [Aliifodinibius sp. S!AR15-10]